MIKALKKLFALLDRDPYPSPPDYSLSGMLNAMREKDPDLAKSVVRMSPAQAWRSWQEVYPEDFPDGGMSIPGAHCIVRGPK